MYLLANDWISTGAPINLILRVLNLKKSTYYRWRSSTEIYSCTKNSKEDRILGLSYTFDGKKINDVEIQKLIAEI